MKKLDHNNFETHRKEFKQSYEIRQWARQLGIEVKDFETKIASHPNVSDLDILLDLNMYKHFFNKKDTQVFTHIWHQVYKLEYPLSAYHRKKLVQVVDSTEFIMKKAVIMMSKKGGPLAESSISSTDLLTPSSKTSSVME